jgi:hypothetical protein
MARRSVNGISFHNANKGYQNDTLNPYFIHPNENLALVLVTSCSLVKIITLDDAK